MAEPGRNDVLAAAEELERRDGEQAAAVAQIADLARRTDELRLRSEELQSRLASIPDELAGLAPLEQEARGRRDRLAAEAAEAEQRAAAGKDADAAARAVADAGRNLEAADERIARLAAQSEALRDEERRAREEASRVERDTRVLAAELACAPRVAAAGVIGPTRGLEGVAEWAKRTHAALLVARSGLEGERERTVREAAELGSSVLGEPVVLGSVATIRRRLQRELTS